MLYSMYDIFLMLTSIKHDGSTDFVQNKLSCGTVGGLIYQLLTDGYIVENGDELILTENGKMFLYEINLQLNNKGINKCISTLPDAYIQKISIDDVYLPENI